MSNEDKVTVEKSKLMSAAMAYQRLEIIPMMRKENLIEIHVGSFRIYATNKLKENILDLIQADANSILQELTD